MDVHLDLCTVLLTTVNIVEMVTIYFLLYPFCDVVTLSNKLKTIQHSVKSNRLICCLLLFAAVITIYIGIFNPTKVFNELKRYKFIKRNETAAEKIMRIIRATNALRNYMLGVFSLFFYLVLLRLFDFIYFSAKLHEFYNLMANYDLIDITYTENEPELHDESSFIIEEEINNDDEMIHWPSVAEFDEKEHERIKEFFKSTLINTETKEIPHENEKN